MTSVHDFDPNWMNQKVGDCECTSDPFAFLACDYLVCQARAGTCGETILSEAETNFRTRVPRRKHVNTTAVLSAEARLIQ